MPEQRPPGRGRRRTPPPRDILAGQVRVDELPDVARPGAPAPPPDETIADPGAHASANAARVSALARSLLELGRLPLVVSEAALEGQAQAIDDWLARGAVPSVLVPGAMALTLEMRLLTRMLRAVSRSNTSGPSATQGSR